jgi:two-component system phosphate regulon sensor histidine kinase PhoR
MLGAREIILNHQVVTAAAVGAAACVVTVVSGLTAWPALGLGSLAFAGTLGVLRASSRNGLAGLADASGGTRSSDMSWRPVIDAMTDPAIVLDAGARVLHASRPARELFVTLAEGQSLIQVSRNPELLNAVEQVLADRTSRNVQALERVPLERRLSVTISPLQGSGTDLRRPALLLVFKDVSEEERLAQMRADFIANASHELRTPLTSLRGFIETLQGQARDDPGARRQFLEIMSAQAGRMTRLLDDLLSLSRVEMRAHVPPREEVEINEIVQEVVDLLQPIAEEAGIALRFAPAPAPCPVRGDRDELVQVVQNLAQNAIKYGRRGGHVDVRVAREIVGRSQPDRIVISVTDDGVGIAEEHLPRLTERFYRVDVMESRDKGGTGLGLAIVKHILNRHGGQLRITSKLGQGSTFTVLLDALR